MAKKAAKACLRMLRSSLKAVQIPDSAKSKLESKLDFSNGPYPLEQVFYHY